MPMRRFWFYHRQAGRLKAEQDLRMLSVVASAQSGEAITKLVEDLKRDLGELVIFEPGSKVFDANEIDPEFDRQGLADLKAKLGFASMVKTKEEEIDVGDQG